MRPTKELLYVMVFAQFDDCFKTLSPKVYTMNGLVPGQLRLLAKILYLFYEGIKSMKIMEIKYKCLFCINVIAHEAYYKEC
jgi:hypothetical protein